MILSMFILTFLFLDLSFLNYFIILISIFLALQNMPMNFSFIEHLFFVQPFNFFLTFLSLTILLVLKIFLNSNKNYNFSLILILTFIMVNFFLTNNIINFYILFELRVIPIFFLILGFGYQPERYNARILIFLYTVFASSPILVIILQIKIENITHFTILSYLINNSFISSNYWVFLILRFLVKFPILLLHDWLPFAHVEASIEGSIILASVLLKIGGWGIYQFLRFIKLNSLIFFLIFTINLIALAIVPYLILTLSDLKLTIAYSSIAHMALTILLIMLKSSVANQITFLIFIVHGFVSPALFFLAFSIYKISNSRNLFLNKTFKLINPTFSFLFFINCLLNISGPFTPTLFPEIISVILLLIVSLTFLPFMFFILILNIGFNINITIFNTNKNFKHNLTLSKNISYKFFLILEFLTMLSLVFLLTLWKIFTN